MVKEQLSVFEMGFGTGLNAFLTAIHEVENQSPLSYTAVESHPLSTEEASALNYPAILGYEQLFQQLHAASWNKEVKLHEFFRLQKVQTALVAFISLLHFDLIYYDAFAPSAQPELWTKEIFEKLFVMLNENGVLVTYCSKGDVRRAMIAAGFSVEKIPGPRGTREMLRGRKDRKPPS
jgi:tRNA U34 5-methylaminomethyl-2-thiouridine-forming methyltransferase MnmC